MDTRYKLATEEKLRGGYYTPPVIADWLCRWAIRRSADRVLEPSCGDGVFLLSAMRTLASLGATPERAARQTVGVELLPSEARKCRRRLREAGFPVDERSVVVRDFFQWIASEDAGKFDCVVGNPPFIRYHNFPEPSRTTAMNLMERLGLKPNRLTNMWVPFVAGSVEFLAAGGRLAMVLPAELLQVTYAGQLRHFLAQNFQAIGLVTCNDMVFPGAQQEVVLFLGLHKKEAPGAGGPCAIELVEMDSLDDLLSLSWDERVRAEQLKPVNHKTDKWLKYLLTAKEIALLKDLEQSDVTTELGAVASVDIGVVTGRNQFFLLSRQEVAERGLSAHSMPTVARAHHLQGAVFTTEDHARLAAEAQRVFLFVYEPLLSPPLPRAARRYIAEGEEKGFHRGYKCSIRQPWYAVPGAWTPDCFLFRQIHDFPRLVINRANATSTDTIHRLSCCAPPEALVARWYSHLTAASSEIEGRSYGGGVLELEPTEAERVMIPNRPVAGLPIPEIDRLVRAGRLKDVLVEHDRLILREGLGLSRAQCAMLRGIWEKLRDRRHARKKRKRT